MCWCDHFKYVPEYRATLFLQEELGQLYLLRSVMSLYCCKSINWCLEDSSCSDFLTLSFVCYMSMDCSGGLCLAQRVSNSYIQSDVFWLTMSMCMASTKLLHILAALCMTTYSMHTLVSCDPWITGSFSSICWKSHLYYTCTKYVCITFRDWKS